MLIITRRVNEKVIINNNIIITILRMEGGNVKMGVDAPKEISVHREEIYKKIHGIIEDDDTRGDS